jgi:hypothetical protein
MFGFSIFSLFIGAETFFCFFKINDYLAGVGNAAKTLGFGQLTVK